VQQANGSKLNVGSSRLGTTHHLKLALFSDL
jgi:hypothetical protein